MKRRIKKGCGCLLGALLLLCIAGAIAMYLNKPKWSDEYGQRFTDVAYGNREHNTYNLYLPNDAAQQDSLGRPYDLIVFPNSGHFLNSDKDCSERYDSTMNAYCKKYFGY